MFRSVKLKNGKRTVFALSCAVLLIIVCLIIWRGGAPDSVTIDGESRSLHAADDAELRVFLTDCGYETNELLSEKDVTIPKHWNAVYEAYQELQRRQGFDLLPYKGKPAKELTFAAEDEYVTLLICRDQIIAAHISDPDGANMRPLI